MKKLILCIGLSIGCLIGCQPVERQAYNTVVGAKAFLNSIEAKHPECPGPHAACTALTKAIAAKDLLVDAGEAYCRVDAFPNGDATACNPYPKGTDKYTLAAGALGSALRGYEQAAKDLKGLVK